MAYELIGRLKKEGKHEILTELERAVTTKRRDKGKIHEVWKELFDWKFCETIKFAYQKLTYMHNNLCAGKWKLVLDITKYEHSSARYYITGGHAAYTIKDIEEIFSERYSTQKGNENFSVANKDCLFRQKWQTS